MKQIISIIILFMLVLFSTCLNLFASDLSQAGREYLEYKYPPKERKVKNLGDGRIQLGNIIVDRKKKEVIVQGRINMKSGVIEYIACTKGGNKSYESVLEMDTDAKTFNLSMIFLGLDPTKGKACAFHFDPNPPQGDPVEISIHWDSDEGEKTVMAQELILDMKTEKTFPASQWVYTGSVFLRNRAYLADRAGVLIGFVHDPAPVIESPQPISQDSFGSLVVNSAILPEVGTKIHLIIKPFENKKE